MQQFILIPMDKKLTIFSVKLIIYLLELDLSISLAQISVVMLGGAFGAAARFIVTSTMTEKFSTAIPYGTLTVNVIGSFVIGLLAILLIEHFAVYPLLKLGVFIGFLGAFTTFSTFSVETLVYFEQGQHLRALGYSFASVFLSVMAVWLGTLMGKALN